MVAAVLVAVAACTADDPGLETDGAHTAATDPGSTTTALADVPPPTAAGAAFEIELVGETSVPAGLHTWHIELTNTTDTPVMVTFPTSQQADVVLSQQGTVAHRWSNERFFRQQVTELAIAAGATESFELADDLRMVEPGFYEVTVRVAVVGPPDPVTENIRVVSVAG